MKGRRRKARQGFLLLTLGAIFLLSGGTSLTGAAPSFTPTRPIEWVIPAGTGGGADQQARFMAPLIAKYKLSPQPFIPVNRPAGAGAQGFLYMIERTGSPHIILITLDNLFTTPLVQVLKKPDGSRFTWRDMTPIARLLLDNFALTVRCDRGWKTVADFKKAVESAPPGTFKMSGTGSKQEDEIIMVLLELTWKVDFTYVPFPGGGAVAAAVVGGQTDFSVNNPLEMVGHWDAGRLCPLAVFAPKRIPFGKWKDVPTMKELGYPIEYQMLRGVFGPPEMPKEAVAFYQDVFRKLMDTPEMKDFIERGAFDEAFLTGPAFEKWLEEKDRTVRNLMIKGGLIPKS